jgi:hypothetical protein
MPFFSFRNQNAPTGAGKQDMSVRGVAQRKLNAIKDDDEELRQLTIKVLKKQRL